MLCSVSSLLFLLAVHPISAQEPSTSDDLASPTPITAPSETPSSISTASVSIVTPTGPQTVVYLDGSTLQTSVVGATITGGGSSNASASSSPSSASGTTSTGSLIGITGGANPTGNSSATASTSSRPQQTNTRPCNGHVELCDRKLSNISMVVAHNSPFVVPHNAASNQIYPVLTQLEDGIRGCKSSMYPP